MNEASENVKAFLELTRGLSDGTGIGVLELYQREGEEAASLGDLRVLVAERTWQPIETAPQKPAARGVRGDQEALLVWRPGLPEGISAFQHLPDAEWYSCETGMPLGWKPTRWQPLPEPPESTTSIEGQL